MTHARKLPAALLFALTVPTIVYAQASVPVTVRPLSEVVVASERSAPAIVVSANRADITSQVAAIIDRVVKDVGDDVRKGELLIQLDEANAKFALLQAEASLAAIDAQIEEARSRLAKAEDLLARNFISDEELVSRRAALDVLQAQRRGQLATIDVAQLELQRTQIKAPFDAAVIERQAQVGSYAQPGSILMTLVQTGGREIEAELDPRYAGSMPTVSGLGFVSQGKTWPIRLARISSVIDSASRVVKARFVFVDEPAPVGASGQVSWQESSGLVPVDLIVQRGSELGVFRANGNKAEFVPIPGAQAGRPAAVALDPDTPIVARGQARLQDGDALQISRQ